MPPRLLSVLTIVLATLTSASCRPPDTESGATASSSTSALASDSLSPRSHRATVHPRLEYSTYFGGTDLDQPSWSVLAPDGSYYISGLTYSADLPTTPGAYSETPNGGLDGYVVKLDREGGVAFATYLGGSGDDFPLAIDVDGRGDVFVTGFTTSQDFPVTANALQPTFAGGVFDAVVVKLSKDGSRLEYSTYLGGSDDDIAMIGPVDRPGHVHVIGYTYSTDFPVTERAFQTTHAGAGDAFVSELSLDGSRLVYSTFVGGSGEDQAWDGNIDGEGNIYFDGFTASTDFPVTPRAFQQHLAGPTDAMVAGLSRDGSRLRVGSYLGGSGDELVADLGLDRYGNLYVVGTTTSTDLPVTANAPQPTFGGGSNDGYVARIGRDGTVLSFATYVGGSDSDQGGGIRVDARGAMYVLGTTSSTDLLTTADAIQTGIAGATDLFVRKIDRAGKITYSTYLGGSDVDGAWGSGCDIDERSRFHFAAFSFSSDFPVTEDAYQVHSAGGVETVYSVISLGNR